jgi:hypothetical protein
VVIRSLAGEVDATFEVTRRDKTITIVRQGSAKPWQVLLAGEHAATVEGGTSEATPQGVLVKPAAGSVKITLA